MILEAASRLAPRASVSAIIGRIEEATGRAMALASAYAAIQRLVGAKLLSIRQMESSPVAGGRSKSIYFVTEPGKQALRDAYQSLDRLRIDARRSGEEMA
jgi:DNA-binding PadR family transcriptional regulator